MRYYSVGTYVVKGNLSTLKKSEIVGLRNYIPVKLWNFKIMKLINQISHFGLEKFKECSKVWKFRLYNYTLRPYMLIYSTNHLFFPGKRK